MAVAEIELHHAPGALGAAGVDTSPVVVDLARGLGGRQRVPLRIDALEPHELLEAISLAVADRRPLTMMSANLHWVSLTARHPELLDTADQFDLLLLDGTPLRWLLEAHLGRPVSRLAGADLVPQLCQWSAVTGRRLYFLGAGPGVADEAANRARDSFPGCTIVGTHSPTPEEVADPERSRLVCRRINAARPDVLFVALGMPQQERWILRHADDLEVPVRFGVGGSLDFLAGAVPRAPGALQTAGLEWAWRVLREPRRLWRRYLVEDLPYGLGIAAELARLRAAGPGAGSGARAAAPSERTPGFAPSRAA